VLTLGIPGSAPAAVLLAAMVLHGVRPGPMIMIEFPTFVYEVVVMTFFAAVAMLVLGILLTPLLLKVLAVRRERLMPVVFVLCVIGSYAIAQRMFDVWVMVIFGVLGFALRQMKYPMAPLVLGIVLGDILDKSFRRSWVIHNGDFTFYFDRPICVVLMILCVFTILTSAGPTKHYVGSRLHAVSEGFFGGLARIVGAHWSLALAFGRAVRAMAGRPVPGLPIGVEGLARGVREGVVSYAGTVARAIYGFLRAIVALAFDPLFDLLRLLRILPRTGSGA
jgi:hypothetical protein